MPAGPVHRHERDRLAALRSYHVLDTPPDPAIDAVTAAAAKALNAPVALVSLLDEYRQWFKAAAGPHPMFAREVRETPREMSFCAHVVAAERPLLVPDATHDVRFADNELVTGPVHLRFYAGAPLIGRDGLPLGALCVLDTEPRDLGPSELALLVELAGAVTELLELRRVEAVAGFGTRDLSAEGHRLRRGIDDGELVVHYQPVVDLPSARWVGVEALVRWDHPERGLLPPVAFLPVAEASGLIVALGREVLEQACRQVAQWRRSVPGAARLHLAVNVSGRQLLEPDVVDVVQHALASSGLPAEALVLELTETALAASTPGVDAALRRIRALGVALALDDFGTGYSALSYLQRFEPDVVKIDRCFISALSDCARDVSGGLPPDPSRTDTIVTALVDMALRLGCHIVAEGIERPSQADALTRLGVRNAQGYLYSKPRPAADLQRELHRRVVPVAPQS